MSITVRDLAVKYGRKTVVSDISLDFSSPGVYGIVGPNGAGKSTLMRAVAGVQDFSGTVLYDDQPLVAYSRAQRVEVLSYIAQYSGPPISMTVRDVVTLGRTAGKGLWRGMDSGDEDVINQSMNHTDVYGLADRPLAELSGGQVQRVMLARAMAQQASHMLLDEPNNHLDLQHQYNLMSLLRHFSREHGVIVLIAIHDIAMAARFCDSVALIGEGGILLETGPADEILTPNALKEVFGVHAKLVEIASGRVVLDVEGTTLRTWGLHLDQPQAHRTPRSHD